ncbi:MAG TPA: methylated-DNA--[protein]-cysteine S-methyltransferase [Nitrospirota bacterium]
MRYDQKRIVFKTSLGWVGAAATERGVNKIVLPKKNKDAVARDLAKVRRSQSRSPLPAGATAREQAKRREKNAERAAVKKHDIDLLKYAAALLRKYFAGERVLFDVPLDLRYYTPFQQAVWRAVAEIPQGETRTYAWVAKRIGKPAACRAAGQAVGANPVPIFIPCHRVISSAGTLGGFSGGPGMKKKLLELEKYDHRARREKCM